MGETPFHAFITLVQLDQAINALAKLEADHDQRIKVLQEENARHQRELEAVQQRAHVLQREVDLQELEMKSLDQNEKDKKVRMENAQSSKEYLSFKQEIEHVKQKQLALEDTLVNAWNDLENAKKEYAQQKIRAEQERTKVDEAIAKIEKEKEDVIAQLVQKKSERAPIEARVPAEWLQKYAYMRTKVTDPVVPVVNGACGACFLHLSEQEMIALGHRKLLQCKDCFRLLYLESAHTSSTKEATP